MDATRDELAKTLDMATCLARVETTLGHLAKDIADLKGEAKEGTDSRSSLHKRIGSLRDEMQESHGNFRDRLTTLETLHGNDRRTRTILHTALFSALGAGVASLAMHLA